MIRNDPPSVSIVVPAYNESEALGETLTELVRYVEGTGLSWEILVVNDGSTDGTAEIARRFEAAAPSLKLLELDQNRGKGAAVRHGVLESTGDVVAFIDADLPYELQNLENAIALVHSGATDLAIGARDLAQSERDPSYPFFRRLSGKTFSWIVRFLLVNGIPDTQCGLKVFSREAAQTLFRQSRIEGFGFDFEILYLARKYGFRVARIPVTLWHRHESKVSLVRDSFRMLRDLFRVRLTDRHLGYRAAPPCPVCMSIETWTRTEIESRVVRECRRCKCRFLAKPPTNAELEKLYEADYFRSEDALGHGYAERDPEADRATAERRLKALSRIVPPGSSVLELGCGTGEFGLLASEIYEYTGIDLSSDAVRESRDRGLNVVRASLENYVSTTGRFDCIAGFHLFEHLLEPHTALDRICKLLRPGGHLLLITPDTESLLSLISGDSWVSYKFPEHVILYSRSALLELLEQGGFEIVRARGDFEFHRHSFILSRLEKLSPAVARAGRWVLKILPEPLPVTSGSVMIVARRRTTARLIAPSTTVATERAR